jgi:DNA-binding MarR family transcriptional regulator
MKNSDSLREQAAQLEQLMPSILRRMFALDPDNPIAELPVAQLRILSILQAGPRTLSALGMELGISVSATTQIADRLEKSGMVQRVPSVEDRRTKYLQLTAHGAEMMATRREARVQRAMQALALLTPEEREAMLKVLTALLQATIATALPAVHEDPLGVRQEQ